MDWRGRFRAGTVRSATVARRNPERGLVVADRAGTDEAYAWTVGTGALRRLTEGVAPVIRAAVAPDGDAVIYLHDRTGSEYGHLHRVAFEGGAAIDLTPTLAEYAIEHLEVADGLIAAVAATRDAQHLLFIREDRASLVPQPTLVSALVILDADRIATAEPMDGLITRTTVRDATDGAPIARLDRSRPGAVHGGTLAVALHRDGWLRPATWVPGEEPRPLEVEVRGDLVPTDWSADGTELLLLGMHRGRGGLWLADVAEGTVSALHAPPGAPLPWGRPFLLGPGVAASVWSSAETPWSVVRHTSDESEILLTVDERDRYPGAGWAEVTFLSSDGSECQAWLLRPDGSGGPWPTILYSHGGPTAVASPTFSAICQAWADHGYAVLSVNYRGSTSFGDAYREALTGRVGEVDVADMVAAHRWLLDSGTAIPELVILNGWSWGGYLTLQTMGTHPGLWAAGIAGAPLADWILSTEDQSASLDAYDRALFGTDISEDREARIRASPRTHVARFDAPVLITTPREDSRAPLRQVEAFVHDLRAAGKEARLDVVTGGHVGIGQEHWIAIMDSWLAFADEVVARRHPR